MATGPSPVFRADLKCCMYMPRLPNFIVGRILDDREAEQGPVRARLADAHQRSPWGLQRPEGWRERYEAALEAGRFGQALELRCPHWRDAGGGTCGIWAHREATCSTWHCRVDRGAVGKAAWTDLRRWLEEVQDLLARWCIAQVGAPTSWSAEEAETFYRACGRAVEALSLEEIKQLGGFGLRMHSRALRTAWRARARPELPPRLQAGRWQVLSEDAEGVTLRSYGEYDGLRLSRAEWRALHAFDGRAVAEVCAALGEAAPSPERLQEWVDHRLLQPSG